MTDLRNQHRIYALIYDGITRASDTAPADLWIHTDERQRIAAHVFNELRAAGLEVRLPDTEHQPRHAAEVS